MLRSLIVALLITPVVVADEDPRLAPRWIKQLLSENQREYDYAIHKLGLLREEAAPAYLAGLDDRNPELRYHCARLLMTCEAEIERDMVPALARALRDTTRDVRTCAAMLLAEAGESAMPALFTVLTTEDGKGPRYAAARALARIGPPAIRELDDRLGQAPAKSRAGVVRDIALVATAQMRDIRWMRAAFMDESLRTDPWRSFRICRYLRTGTDGYYEQPHIPIGFELAISRMEPLVLRIEAAAPRTVALLVRAMDDEEPEVRAIALRALGELGDWAGKHRPAFRNALDDGDEAVREAAAYALRCVGATEVLFDALKSDNEAAATAAAGALRHLEPVKQLAPLLDDANPVVRKRAIELAGALGKYGFELRAKLNEIARDGDEAAIAALARIASGGALAHNYDVVKAARRQKGRDARIAFLEEAAFNGNLLAKVELARLTAKRGDPIDAMEWYRQAAERGDAALKEELGDAYFDGTLGERDIALAVAWWARATNAGSISARVKVADALWSRRWIPGDRKWLRNEAARWYQPAAEKGNAWAQYRLGVFHEDRDGLGDEVAAARWYLKAALQGETHAYLPLAKTYLGKKEGGGYVEYLAWRRLAADAGNEEAKEDERDDRRHRRSVETRSAVRDRVKELRKLIDEDG
jgi:TPR repeat protein